jgi:hypothetical protein
MSQRRNSRDGKARAAQGLGDVVSPLVAAYETGGLLNRLDWHVQQAWLLPAVNPAEARRHSEAVVRTLTDLSVKVCDVVRRGTERRVADAILERRDLWQMLFNSPVHRDAIKEGADQLRYELGQEFAEVHPTRLREEVWDRALQKVRYFALQTYEAVVAAADERVRDGPVAEVALAVQPGVAVLRVGLPQRLEPAAAPVHAARHERHGLLLSGRCGPCPACTGPAGRSPPGRLRSVAGQRPAAVPARGPPPRRALPAGPAPPPLPARSFSCRQPRSGLLGVPRASVQAGLTVQVRCRPLLLLDRPEWAGSMDERRRTTDRGVLRRSA